MGATRALVFDFNGTLSHDEPVLYAIYAELFAEHGRPLTETDYYGRLAGNTEEAIIGGWLGVDGDELEGLVDERIERYVRVPVGIVSGAYRREIEPVVEKAGLADVVAHIVAADDVAHGKPDPEGYLRMVELLGDGLRPAEAVAFEDTEAGIASALGAGLRCLGVRGTLPDARLAAAESLVDAIDVELVRSLVG
jgi:beta-phosphoglucomutase